MGTPSRSMLHRNNSTLTRSHDVPRLVGTMSTKNEPKTENVKTETSNASATNAGANAGATGWRMPMPWEMPMFGQDAFARMPEMFARGLEVFARAMHEQLERTQKVMDELASYEAVAAQRARAAVADLAKLATDSLDYAAKLSAEWRKLAVEGSRRAVDQVAPRA